ncbi:hypothetical protein U0C82_13230 [Fulvimarina sp. 2208YS6-2-32]|uniref:Uncharacterized protein n=1 Tax=Fulvimarina uroteuthidis TaxID=3098149 RepID=A0ABU5I3Z2_9HYPH|nr:hypothetical protein [Fulvimarina sp. 2208YS6-2-32]MDY8110104.1 hypothetical protein [Fulvimarina sp. 2208YS6-2-32]
MTVCDQSERHDLRASSMPRPLPALAMALATIIAIGIVGRMAGGWTERAAMRMGSAEGAMGQITEWRGNSAHLPEPGR